MTALAFAGVTFLFIILSSCLCLHAESRSRPFNQLAVDIPFDGGGMLTCSRYYPLGRFILVGGFLGGGVIDRHFDVQAQGGPTMSAKTQSLILPIFGPMVTFYYNVIGISLGYGFYYGRTDLTVNDASNGTLTGRTTGWGNGIYSPLLVMDFYDTKHNLFWGLGIGGFFGTGNPDLSASNASTSVTTNASPLTTLTVHLRATWGFGGVQKTRESEEF